MERVAAASLGAGSAMVLGRETLRAQSPAPPANVRVGTSFGSGPGTFLPEPGFSASGTFGDGATVTVSASSGAFGTKPNGAKPLFWFPLKDDLNLSPLARGSFNPTYGFVGSLSGANCPLRSAKTLATEIAVEGDPYRTNRIIDARGELNLGSDAITRTYLAIKRNWDFSPAAKAALGAEGCKWGRFINSNFSAQVYFAGRFPEQDWEVQWYNGTDQNSLYGGRCVGSQWFTNEVFYKASTDNVADGLYKLVENGLAVFGPNVNNAIPITRSGQTKLRQLTLEQFNNPNPAYGQMWVYYDYIYWDDSWCHVWISDEVTYQDALWGSSTEKAREIQIPTAWSDTSISFVVRQGSHVTLSGKVLYAMLSDGTVRKIGSFA